jgi:uncharacterized protein YfaP (DUF2135 family)
VSRSLKSDLGEKARRWPALAALIVNKTALDIMAGAQARSRVDTGAMKNGWRVVDGDDEYSKQVVNSVEYSKYHEYGTRHMSAQPMAVPAAEEARPSFEAAVGKALE